MFSKEELIADGLTEEEAELFLTTDALADTVEMLPADIESFIKAYEIRAFCPRRCKRIRKDPSGYRVPRLRTAPRGWDRARPSQA